LSEKAWVNLREIINAPINIEAALEHLAEEKLLVVDAFGDEIETAEETSTEQADGDQTDEGDEPIPSVDAEQISETCQQEPE
jgi:hypothetical protein